MSSILTLPEPHSQMSRFNLSIVLPRSSMLLQGWLVWKTTSTLFNLVCCSVTYSPWGAKHIWIPPQSSTNTDALQLPWFLGSGSAVALMFPFLQIGERMYPNPALRFHTCSGVCLWFFFIPITVNLFFLYFPTSSETCNVLIEITMYSGFGWLESLHDAVP